MKKLLALFAGLFLLCGSAYAQCPTAPGTGVYVMFNSTYQLGTIAAGETNVKMCYANTTPATKISGVQFRVWYDKNAFAGGAPVVTSLNTSFPQDLQFVTNTTEGNITVTLTYTGSSSTFSIPDGELFNLKLVHTANFQNFVGATYPTPMSVTGVTAFPNGASDINGIDATLVAHNFGGVFQAPMLNYSGNFLTVTGAGAKNIPVILQRRPIGGTTWTDIVTSTTTPTGAFTFSEPIDLTYYEARIHVVGSSLNFGNIITTADADKANQIVLGTVTPTGFDFYSADPNGSNTITVADVYSIFGRIAGRFTAWPNTQPDVLFFTASQYATINGSATSQRTAIPGVNTYDNLITLGGPTTETVYTLGIGDTNNTGFQMARMTPIEIVNPNNANQYVIDKTIVFDNATEEIEMKLPSLSVQEGNLVSVPVTVLTNGTQLGSLQYGVWYDNTLLEFRGIDNNESLSNWMSYINPEDNIIDWGGYDPSAHNNLMKNGDTPFVLKFVALQPQDQWTTSPLWVTRKAAGDAISRDVNIRPTDGRVQILRINGYEVDVKGNSFLIYPNPTDGIVTFAFNIAESSKATLGLYDMGGKKCLDILTDRFPSGKYSYTVDLGNLPSGIYNVVLNMNKDNQIIGSKLIKQ